MPADPRSGRSLLQKETSVFRLKADDSVSEVMQVETAALTCTQEDTDARMLLNAAHADDHAIPAVVIRSPDSDVAVITVSITHQIDTQLIFRTRTHHRTKYLDLAAIGCGIGHERCNVFPGYHALFGCDSTSAFTAWKGQGFRLQITKS